jgi:transposase
VAGFEPHDRANQWLGSSAPQQLIKREMYGRANFDLLRQRVLHEN